LISAGWGNGVFLGDDFSLLTEGWTTGKGGGEALYDKVYFTAILPAGSGSLMIELCPLFQPLSSAVQTQQQQQQSHTSLLEGANQRGLS
jgi:hypothetical protein